MDSWIDNARLNRCLFFAVNRSCIERVNFIRFPKLGRRRPPQRLHQRLEPDFQTFVFFEYNSADSAMSRNMFFLDVPSRMLSQMWIQSSWSRICHKGVLLPEVQSAQPPVDPPVAPEEPTEQPTAEPMGLRQRRGKGRRNGMCTDVLESPVSNISRECKLSRRTPQTPIWPFLEIEKPVNEPICFLCMVRSYKEPPSVS